MQLLGSSSRFIYLLAQTQYIRYLSRTDTLFIAHEGKEVCSLGAGTNYLRISAGNK